VRKSVVFTVVAIAVAAWFLAERFNKPREFTTTSPEAYELYLKGDQALNAYQWLRAEHFLQEALQIDPSFAMAQAALAEVYTAYSTKETVKEAIARADSLTLLLENETERMLVELRLSRLTSEYRANQDSLLQVLAKRQPKHPLVIVTKARRAGENQDAEKAEALWHELLEIDPNYANAYNFLGYLADAQGKYDEAISYLQRYAFLAPDLANPHDSLGEILMHMGRYEDAEREYRKALEIQPDFFNSLLMLAQIYIEQGRVKKGVDILEKTRDQIAGTKFELHVDYMLVNTYYTHKLDKECGQACVRFFTSHSEFFDSAHFRSYHLVNNGEFDEARAVHDSLIAAAAEYKWVKESEKGKKWLERKRNCFEANFAEKLNELDSAAALWEKCVVETANLPPHERNGFKTNYAEVLLKLGRHEEAFTQAGEILSINPNLIRPLMTYVSAAASLGRYDEARQAMERLDAILANADPDLPAQATAENLRSQISRFPSS